VRFVNVGSGQHPPRLDVSVQLRRRIAPVELPLGEDADHGSVVGTQGVFGQAKGEAGFRALE
jgi:hypothetical protein